MSSDGLHDNVGLVAENKLWVPNKEKLNDPTELRINDLEFITFLKKHKKYSQHVEQLFKDLKHFVETSCGIFSLSKDVKNELLWAHYANGHRGFCIEYDSDIIMESYNSGSLQKDNPQKILPLVQCLKVEYESNLPVFKSNYLDAGQDLLALKCLVATKSINWEYEKEVRLVFDNHGEKEIDYRAVTGIYFGTEFTDKEKRTEVMEKLQGRGIKYYEMKFYDNSYKMYHDEIVDEFAASPKYIANNLPFEDIIYSGMPRENIKYKDLAIRALEYVSKEPCINKIRSCYVSSTPMIAIETCVNNDFKANQTKIYRFDIDEDMNEIRLRKLQLS